ncbi:hypothetical protein [Pseudomonas sp. Snoq117.2]|uniref:hypothetical protein n=1 Tax=Pseudomonas sp. Snoq117.2 TaxID=1500302 RepID=UPI0008AD0819|nr:hypothetical protein [Pseudomonas sp. Snoq117.2]SEP27631.1 hypothetical protein SAMN02787149_105209 [Pseudomonas sp. Snoq117.2]
MQASKVGPVSSKENLKKRVKRFFRFKEDQSTNNQLKLNLSPNTKKFNPKINNFPKVDLFLDFLSKKISNGDLYLFGGALRDLAFFGSRGFNSDLDLVTDGDWEECKKIVESLQAEKNKFDGYRLEIAGCLIDFWHAEKTWAIANGHIKYEGIESLTKTTILNWDAILMNWRTKDIICAPMYFEEIEAGRMDIVLEENPNPLGACIRVFRHLCLKDAKSISKKTAEFLANSTAKYSLIEITEQELSSYGSTVIDPNIYKLFEKLKNYELLEINERFRLATSMLEKENRTALYKQLEWSFED